MPFFTTVLSADTLVIENVSNGLHTDALQIEIKNPANYSRFRFVDYELTVYKVEAVSRSTAVEFTGFHSLFITPPHILRYGHAFLLGNLPGKVANISLFIDLVSSPWSSKYTLTSICSSARSAVSISSVFRAKRDMDFTMMRSIRPFLQSRSIRRKSSRFSMLVPVIPSSA